MTSSGGENQQRKFANFRDTAFFPDYEHLPHQEDLDNDFYRLDDIVKDGLELTPLKNWCFFAEIVSVENFTRLVLNVKSGRRNNLRVALYTDDKGFALARKARVGHSVAVMYANQHYFLDGSEGVRVEVPVVIQIIPLKLSELLELNDRVQIFSTLKAGGETMCHGCSAQKTSMQKCSRCSMFYYCDKSCQTAGWKNKGHQKDCKVIKDCGLRAMFSLDWGHFDGFLGFPLPGPE